MEDKIYTVDKPDPVAESAAAYAVEVTNVTQPHPWLSKFVWFAISFIIIVGTAGAVLGTINTVQVNHQNTELKGQTTQLKVQNDQLKKEQICQANILTVITTEQAARAKIAKEDRTALSHFYDSILSARTAAQRQSALAAYNTKIAENDRARAKHPVPTVDKDTCNLSK